MLTPARPRNERPINQRARRPPACLHMAAGPAEYHPPTGRRAGRRRAARSALRRSPPRSHVGARGGVTVGVRGGAGASGEARRGRGHQALAKRGQARGGGRPREQLDGLGVETRLLELAVGSG